MTPDEETKSKLEELDRKTRELEACLAAMNIVGSSLDLESVLNRSISTAMQVMNCEASSVMLLDEETGELYFQQAAGDASEKVKEIRIPPGEGIAGWVVQNEEPVVIEDARNDPRFYKKADDTTGFVTRSMLAVPLRAKEKIIGVAEAINKKDGAFTKDDLPLFEAYASLAGIAIENARMHERLVRQELVERELDIARQIQTGMQGPETAQFEAFRFTALSIPARSVGGDFYDWISLGEDKALVAIGDVSGKGVPAALLMSNTLSRLRADVLHMESLSEMVKNLNSYLCATSQRGLFVTFLVMLLNPGGVVEYVSAGHPLPLYLSDRADASLPSTKNPPLGIVPGAAYTSATTSLQEGEVLVFYTDGVTEAASPSKEFFELSRLRAACESVRKTPEKIPATVFEHVKIFERGAERADDLTVLSLAYGSGGPVLLITYSCLTPDDLAEMRRQVETFLAQLALPERERVKIVLAADEVCTNIYRHAYQGKGGPVTIRGWVENGAVYFEFKDKGMGRIPEFPPQTDSESELKPGGLGLIILNEVMDSVTFTRNPEGGCTLRTKKNLEGGFE
ncbi:MAG: GAF domain-containing protein [Candidatus Hydrogenedentota bacterium]|nr:MAG: GAF domain-containing protein [Candidatus Hydrogenedentota bacterium]